jgi:hypothetical protein
MLMTVRVGQTVGKRKFIRSQQMNSLKDKRPQRTAAAIFRCVERVLDMLPLELRFDDGIW